MNLGMIVGGLVILGLTVSDVFETVVVPGGSRATLKVSRRLAALLLPAWKRLRERGISAMFAPILLVLSFAIWMSLLSIGFALVAFGCRFGFHPHFRSFWDALYVEASALSSLGLAGSATTGTARWIVLLAGFSGLGIMTLAVTYLLDVQSNIARRDIGIIELNTAAGDPPSAVALLEKYATIDNQAGLGEILQRGRDWCAVVRQSHCSHPSLIYFRSVNTGAGWPAALGALLDLALLSEFVLKERDLRGRAILLREEGHRMALELASLLRVSGTKSSTSEQNMLDLVGRLRAARYRVQESLDLAQLSRIRSDQQMCVNALADHLGKPRAVLLA